MFSHEHIDIALISYVNMGHSNPLDHTLDKMVLEAIGIDGGGESVM
jgi:hypothetical protein